MNKLQEKIKKTFNEFDGKNLESLNNFYSKKIVFEDPVTKVKGLENLKKYYSHAYKNVKSISFDFDEIFHEGLNFAATWKMNVSVKGLNYGKKYSVPGISKFKFDEDDLVIEHRDYFDLGDMVYERLPVQGMLITFVKKMLARSGH